MHLSDTSTLISPDPNAAPTYVVGAPATGVTADAAPSWFTDISNVLTQGINAYGQLRLQDLNMNLISQGKPPLTAAQVASMAPQLNVGLSPDIQAKIQQYMIFGGIGVLALVALTQMNKRRSR